MAVKSHKGSGGRNDNRNCGKAFKKNPGAAKPEKKSSPKYVDGYSVEKLAIREAKRGGGLELKG